jgi:serine/threonine protein phosphatase PrpC
VVSGNWRPARACSVIGAAHQRQNKPCQDASLGVSLPAGSDCLQLMAVADGHGGSRYHLSHRGSALACEVAQQVVSDLLSDTPLAQTELWQQRLCCDLPARIQAQWLRAIEADWQQRPEASEQPFSALSYGSTLGLALLAPRWWACTGIGDWDLAAVDQQGNAWLMSEETEHNGSEATGSLCQPPEQQHWQTRAQLQLLEANNTLRALVLSTDGVRKSCATDADFLALCAGVVDLDDHLELQRGLAQITRDGSGDDVSLAICSLAICPEQRRSRPGVGRRYAGRIAGLLVLSGLVGLGSWFVLRRPSPLEAQVQALCRQPEQIRTNLTQRQAQFQLLLKQPQSAERLRERAAIDPLGAVIAASQTASVKTCPRLRQELALQWQLARSPQTPTKGKMPASATPGAAPVKP